MNFLGFEWSRRRKTDPEGEGTPARQESSDETIRILVSPYAQETIADLRTLDRASPVVLAASVRMNLMEINDNVNAAVKASQRGTSDGHAHVRESVRRIKQRLSIIESNLRLMELVDEEKSLRGVETRE